MTMKRHSYIVPGYDCRGICTKPEEHKDWGRHDGQDIDRWYYWVSDGECGIELCVRTGLRDGELVLRVFEQPKGQDFFEHYPFPLTKEQLRDQEEGTLGCMIIGENKPCYMSGPYYNAAEVFFGVYGKPTFEQEESFWLALEAYAQEQFLSMKRTAFGRTHKLCPACEGQGVVPCV